MRAKERLGRSAYLRFLLMVLPCFFVLAASSLANASIKPAQVERLWTKVASAVNMDRLPLEIKEEKSPNAWVTSGKSVTVTTGLMKLLQSQDEMFGV